MSEWGKGQSRARLHVDRHNTISLGVSKEETGQAFRQLIGDTYGSVRGLEAIELGLSAGLELILRNLCLQHIVGDLSPKLLVLLVEEHHEARRL
jgi:hypothetical protein